jgi:hypothetical protein
VPEGCQHVHFAAVLEHSPQSGLLKAELLLNHPKWMLSSSANIRFGGFDQIIQSALRRVWQHSSIPGSHGNGEADLPALHLVLLLNSLVVGICIGHGLHAV